MPKLTLQPQKGFIIKLLTEYQSVGSAAFATLAPGVIFNFCYSSCFAYPLDFPNIYEVSCCNYEYNCVSSITDVTSGDAAYCVSYMTRFVSSVVPSYCNKPTIPPTCLSAYLPSALQVLQVLVLYNIFTSLKESIIAVFFLSML